jgi:hypothetical protein
LKIFFLVQIKMSSNNISNYSDFARGYGENAIGSNVTTVPFSYKKAVEQDSAGLNNQVRVLQTSTANKVNYMSSVAKFSSEKPGAALQKIQSKAKFSVAAPDVAGQVINAIKKDLYDSQSAEILATVPKVPSGFAGPAVYTSVYTGRQVGAADSGAPSS